MLRKRLRTSLGITAALAMAGLLGGCATIYFDYPTHDPMARVIKGDRKITLSVGDFKNEMGYSNPNRVSFNVCLDRPVSQAIRKAVIIELINDGYLIGESPYTVSGIIHSIVYGSSHTTIRFIVTDKEQGETLYDKTVYADARTMGMFDEKGHTAEVKMCITRFVQDPDFRLMLPEHIIESWSGE